MIFQSRLDNSQTRINRVNKISTRRLKCCVNSFRHAFCTLKILQKYTTKKSMQAYFFQFKIDMRYLFALILVILA